MVMVRVRVIVLGLGLFVGYCGADMPIVADRSIHQLAPTRPGCTNGREYDVPTTARVLASQAETIVDR